MRWLFILVISLFWLPVSINAQQRVVDASNNTPVSAASIMDKDGNVVGFTLYDGTLPEILESSYPVTVRCIGYEQLVVKRPRSKDWEMKPMVYELEEVVISPVKRNVLKQTFYAREYFSFTTKRDTVAIFMEHMADRFIPLSKDAKFGGSTSLRLLGSRSYARYKVLDEDSVAMEDKSSVPSVLRVLNPKVDAVTAPESFKSGDAVKYYEEEGKSGMAVIQKQNTQTFTTIEDALAGKKEHSVSPWILKLLGLTLDVKQLYVTHAYRTNAEGVYLPEDLIENGFVMEADGRGKLFRKIVESDEPVLIRSMLEMYVVNRERLTKDEAKEQYKNQPTNVKYVIPSTVPALNAATKKMVEKAKSEAKK